MAEYRIDDLARAAAMTTRNVRAYQDRGLLHPPRRAGRVALYDESHLTRLHLIGSMLARGYTTAHITEMLTAWARGQDLADVLGVEDVLIRPWSDEVPTSMPLRRARELAGDRAGFDRLVALGLITVQGARARVTRPQLLTTIAEMRGFGMPTVKVLDLYERVQPGVDEIAAQLVLAAAEHIASVKGPGWMPSGTELGELTQMLGRFRQLAMTSMQQTLAHSMERAIEDVLGVYVAQLSAAAEVPDAG
jgi:DNA-binding transcriptional MerR regulator